MSNLGIPILLLAAIWGAFTAVFRAVEMMTNRRDRFQGFTEYQVGDHLPGVNVKLQFFLDWLPIWLGTSAFLLIFTIVIYYVPVYLDPSNGTNEAFEFSTRICHIIAIIPGIGFIAFICGGLMDVRLFIKGLKRHKHEEENGKVSKSNN